MLPPLLGVGILRIEPGSLTVARCGKPVDRVGAPTIVECLKKMPLQAVEVVRHLDRVGEIIHEDILLPRTPFEYELELVPYTEIEDVWRKAEGLGLENP